MWNTTKHAKWYKSHRKFSFTAHYCMDLYEEGRTIPESIFQPFIKSLYCHSKSEEKIFQESQRKQKILEDHKDIDPSKKYSNDEKYFFCKSLLVHMKEEEDMVMSTF